MGIEATPKKPGEAWKPDVLKLLAQHVRPIATPQPSQGECLEIEARRIRAEVRGAPAQVQTNQGFVDRDNLAMFGEQLKEPSASAPWRTEDPDETRIE